MNLEKQSASSIPEGHNVLKTRSGIHEALGRGVSKAKKDESCSTVMRVDANLLQQVLQEYESDLKAPKSSSQEMDEFLAEFEQSDEMRKKCTSVFDARTKQMIEESLARQNSALDPEKNDHEDPRYMSAVQLIEEQHGLVVINNLNQFPKKTYKELALMMIENEQADLLGRHMFAFKHLDKEVAQKMIEAGQGHYVASTLYPQVNSVFEIDREIALALIQNDEKTGYAVIHNLDRFSPEDHPDLINALLDAGNAKSVVRYLDSIKPLLNKNILFKLVNNGQIRVVAQRLDLFPGLDKEVALKLIDLRYARAVSFHLKRFQGLDREVAERMIQAGENKIVEKNPEIFGLKEGTGLFKKVQEFAQGIIGKK